MSYWPEPPRHDFGTKIVIGLMLVLILCLHVGIKGCLFHGDPRCAFIHCVRVIR